MLLMNLGKAAAWNALSHMLLCSARSSVVLLKGITH